MLGSLVTVNKLVETILENLLTKELHGSGFDGSWKVTTLTKGNFLAQIDYHNMNEHGYYDGWHTINVFLDNKLEIQRITYSADPNTRRKYLWDKSYFEDSIHYALEKVKKQFEEQFDK